MSFFVQEVVDKFEIIDKIYCYCCLVDWFDVFVGYLVFYEDSVVDFGVSYFGMGCGWIDYICEECKKFFYYLYQVINVIIEFDGDMVGSEVYVYVMLQWQDGDKVFQYEFWVCYVDKWFR